MGLKIRLARFGFHASLKAAEGATRLFGRRSLRRGRLLKIIRIARSAHPELRRLRIMVSRDRPGMGSWSRRLQGKGKAVGGRGFRPIGPRSKLVFVAQKTGGRRIGVSAAGFAHELGHLLLP